MRALILIAAMLMLAAVPTAASQAPARVVRPGLSIGGLRLGEELVDLRISLGPLFESENLPNDDLIGYYWPLRRVGAVIDKRTNKAVALAISLDDAYLTTRGIEIGATLDAVRGAYGTAYEINSGESTDMLVYDALGIAFVTDHAGALLGRVSGVFVFVAGHAHDIFPL